MAKRDSRWLQNLMEAIWRRYFPDIARVNPVEIRFGRYARFRFGSIRLVSKNPLSRSPKSIILVTRMFQDEAIPPRVIAYTVAHELAHYAHGFSSRHARHADYPHAGGVVDRELVGRGMGHIVAAYKTWLKSYRKSVLSQKRRFWWR